MPSYQTLSTQLKQAGICQPTLVIDQRALDHNIAQLRQTLNKGFTHRLVVKSLPCLQLIDYISERIHAGAASTTPSQFMCFHGPFIQQIALRHPQSDILLGKPLPAVAFESLVLWFKQQGKKKTAPKLSQVQWLIDSVDRLRQYQTIAKKHRVSLRVNLEIDIGLHRGGFALDAE